MPGLSIGADAEISRREPPCVRAPLHAAVDHPVLVHAAEDPVRVLLPGDLLGRGQGCPDATITDLTMRHHWGASGSRTRRMNGSSALSATGGWTTRTRPAADYVCVGSLPELEAYTWLQAYLV